MTSDVLSEFSAITPTPSKRSSMGSVGFLSLLGVQFLTVLNDHTFRWLVVPLAKPILGDEAAALSLGLIAFMLPFLLFAVPAGFMADRYSKARVIRMCKGAEILVLAAGIYSIWVREPVLLFFIVFLTGTLASLFAPAKMGCIPEIVHDSDLSSANGWMGLMNVVPSALGFLLGNYLSFQIQPTPTSPVSQQGLIIATFVIMGIAVTGWLISLFLPRVGAADPQRRFAWGFTSQIIESFRGMIADPPLMRAAMGIAFFWMLGSLATLNIDQFAKELGLQQMQVGVMGALLVIGVGVGSVLAGLWSAGRVELGLVPFASIGMSFFASLLFFGEILDHSAFTWSCFALTMLGVSSGMFDVPLEAYLQDRADPHILGRVLAATNFMVCVGSLASAAFFYFFIGVMEWKPAALFLVVGVATLPVALYAIFILPGASLRFLFWVFCKLGYRVHLKGMENIPKTGGALLVPNHVTWVDGILLSAHIHRPVRFIIYADIVYNPKLYWLGKIYDVIPIKADGGPKALIQSLRTAREALENGHVVCIFAEGTLTRTGQLQPLQTGFLKILQGTNAPVIPICLHGLWGSIFSYWGKKFFWKMPRRLRYPVSIMFGEPMHDVKSVHEVTLAIQKLDVQAGDLEKTYERSPAHNFVVESRKSRSNLKVADSGGAELTGAKTLASAIAFSRVLRRTFAKDEQNIGIFLPPTVACALANLAVALLRRTAVNLNYTLADSELQFCTKDAELKHVLTSEKFLEKKPLNVEATPLLLEKLKEQVTSFDRLYAGLLTYVLPTWLTVWLLGLQNARPDDVIALIYTSGSTGEPKGVMLTNHNIRFTVDAADQLFQIERTDSVLGVLPIFHCFGYVASFWLPFCLPTRVIFHTNPLDSKEIGRLSEKYKVTILFATPTFLRGYLKRVEKEQFSSLDLVVVGAEKLPLEVAEQFKEKFGVLPSEGYGATETSGPACVNVPDHRCESVKQLGTKLGTVGKPMTGVIARAVNPETYQDVGFNTEGLLLLTGGNIMAGYWKHPERTEKVLKDGWYDTGDMAIVDSDGFVQITGRISRFSKLAGEMVPHLKVEEILFNAVGNVEGDDGSPLLVVTAVPDEKKGERLIVIHRKLPVAPQELTRRASEAGLPNLWIPSYDSFFEVETVPLLGTGKVDLKGSKQLALKLTGKA